MIVVRSVVIFDHGHLLEKVVEFWDFPVHHFGGTQVGEEDAAIAVLFTPETCPESSSLTDGATEVAGSLTVVSTMEQ
jgi:hypothetical protein